MHIISIILLCILILPPNVFTFFTVCLFIYLSSRIYSKYWTSVLSVHPYLFDIILKVCKSNFRVAVCLNCIQGAVYFTLSIVNLQDNYIQVRPTGSMYVVVHLWFWYFGCEMPFNTTITLWTFMENEIWLTMQSESFTLADSTQDSTNDRSAITAI